MSTIAAGVIFFFVGGIIGLVAGCLCAMGRCNDCVFNRGDVEWIDEL